MINEEYILNNKFEEFKKWLNKTYPNLCPYFILEEDKENQIILKEFEKEGLKEE